MPVKNEADDIERVLKTFRGACDYLVIGVDDASTDETEAIARLYADEVFHFHWESDFSKARNACIERCRPKLASTDWIFMSEGHEHLEAGLDALLNLDLIPSRVHVIEVRREDRDHAWMFPWLFRNRPEIYFVNPVHNSLQWNDDYSQVAQLPAVRTWHSRSHRNAQERIQQRRQMNRQELAKRLAAHPADSRSCYYLANEWRRDSPDKAIQYYRRYLAMQGRNGPERYQARLSMAECLIRRVQSLEELKKDAPSNHVERLQQEALQEVYDTLIVASGDDWSRNEHWLYLGDLCARQGNRFEQTMRFYELAAVSINREPLTFMWVEKSNYSWVPAQKLVSVYAEAGMLKEALHWCDRLVDLLPAWAPQEARDEVREHRLTIITKLKEAGSTCPATEQPGMKSAS
jgi:tetratricopeptide (TPR) repeat protein